MAIKNIFFDLDGVLVDLDHSFVGALRTLPEYKDITPADLPRLFPDSFGTGSFELPERFKIHDWINSPFWGDRPIYPGVLDALARLKERGFYMAIISAASGRVEKKRVWIAERFGDYVADIEISSHYESKDEFIKDMLARHRLKKEETVMLDDRFPNLRSALGAGIGAVWRKPDIGADRLPADLAALPVVKSLEEFEKLLGN